MVPGVRPESATVCDVTSELFSADRVPYDAVVPYSICVVEAWSVVQVMVAEVDVTLLEVTAVITGAAAAAAEVEKVRFAEVATVPAEFFDNAA